MCPCDSGLFNDMKEQRREAEAAAQAVKERMETLKAAQHEASETLHDVRPLLLGVSGF